MGLEIVQFVISWEQEFGISIPNEVAAGLVTPDVAGDAVERLLRDAGRPMAREEIDGIIRRTTLENTGLKPAEYRKGGRFVEDFGLD